MNSNFEKKYNEIVVNGEGELNELRMEAKKEKTQNVCKMIFIILAGMMACSILGLINVMLSALFSLAFLTYCIVTLVNNKTSNKNTKMKQFERTYGESVIKPLIEDFGNNINYYTDRGLNNKFYNEAEFEKYDRYSSKNLVIGNLKSGCEFNMSEICTKYKSTDSNGNTTYYILFSGLFFKINLPKKFNSLFYVRSDVKNKGFLKFFKGRWPFDKLRVELDSQEFEKYFDVYCSDKIIAMQLLTADVMQELINFRKDHNIEFELSMKNDCLYLRFKIKDVFNKVSLNDNFIDKEKLYRFYMIMEFVFRVNDMLINTIKDTEYGN